MSQGEIGKASQKIVEASLEMPAPIANGFAVTYMDNGSVVRISFLESNEELGISIPRAAVSLSAQGLSKLLELLASMTQAPKED